MPTVGLWHLELSRVAEPTLKINEPAEEVPTPSRTRHPELSRVTEPVTKGKAEPHLRDRYAPAADVYIYPAEEILDTIEMVEKHMDKVEKCWFYEELNRTVYSLFNKTRTWAEWQKRGPDSTWGSK